MPFLIKFGDMRLKNVASNVFMTFLESTIRKMPSVASFVEHPVNRPIWH